MKHVGLGDRETKRDGIASSIYCGAKPEFCHLETNDLRVQGVLDQIRG
jgi:hypothetical protein